MQYGNRLNRNHRNRNDQPNYGEALLPRLAAHGPEETAALDLSEPEIYRKDDCCPLMSSVFAERQQRPAR
jgi:hypothetical protein